MLGHQPYAMLTKTTGNKAGCLKRLKIMAKRKTPAKQTTPKTDWQEVVIRQRTLLADTSTAVFDLEMSLKALSDNFWTIDTDSLTCLISSLSRTASDIQQRIDLHLAYMPTPEDE